jgi:hypothetical protein
MFVAARLGSQSQIHTRTGVYTLDIEAIMIKGNIIRWLVHARPPIFMRCMRRGKSGCQCPICTVSDGSMVDPLKRVDDERQLLMRWGSTSVALSQPASSAPPIKFCTKNISWIDGIWSPSPTAHLFFEHQPSGLFYLGLILVLT